MKNQLTEKQELAIRAVVQVIKNAEKAGKLEDRNSFAALFFTVRKNRYISIGSGAVETWWDNRSKNWITQNLTKEGYQDGDAEYTGNQSGASIAHFWALCKLLDIK